ncbi:alpha/beta hydrolase [Streptomyces sp. NPDC085946]|uniref:alpha/beta hydrolase n=1 Tax=Streptomyces sp. NPDC085946 TaxID=3365744 RepID=UPI0037D3BD9D
MTTRKPKGTNTEKVSRGRARRLGLPAAALVLAVSATAAGTTASTGGTRTAPPGTTASVGDTRTAPAGTAASTAATPRAAPAAGLAAYYGQHVTWTDCRQGPDDEAGGALDRAGADCARVTVPLDYGRPTGRTIEIAVSRLPAADPARRIGSLVLNPGGPAEAALDMPLATRAYLGGAAARYDLIGVDPRFVGRSAPIDCDWPTGIWIRSAGTGRAAFDRQAAFQKDLAERCARRHGDVLPHATTRNTARDMDVVRAVLGERRISYLGYSYGAYLGAVYTQMFPGRTDRVVLDSAADPRRWGAGPWLGTEPAAERALRAWASWAADRHSAHHLGGSRAEVLATVGRIVRAAGRQPLRVGAHEVDEHVVPYLIMRGVGSDREENRAAFSGMVTALDRAARRLPVTPTPELEELLRFLLDGAGSPYGGQAAAIVCGDTAAPRDPDTYWREIQDSRQSHPLFGPLTHNIAPCAFWPGSPGEAPTEIANGTPALIVSTTGDTATTYRGSRALHRLLTGSRLLTLDGAIGHGVYGTYGNACVDRTVNAYLVSGDLPEGDPTCRT